MNARARFAIASALLAAGILVLVGATYQGVATALERRRYPHPGQLVDVGGHQLHIHCLGEGAPVVVLEAPAASMSAVWGWVQPEVARITRVCAYDRSGLGWSEAGDKPYDPARVPEELRALLAAAAQPGPYVLVGHSLGAAFVRRFAALFPVDTAAVVEVEGSNRARRSEGFMALSPWLARAGVLRATGTLSRSWNGLPPDSAGAVTAFLHRPDHLTRSSREVAREDDARRLAETSSLPAHVAVTRVRADLPSRTDALRLAAVVTGVVKGRRVKPIS